MNKISEIDISIVVLTKNAGPVFEKTLNGIFSQNLHEKIEVIIVDSGSTDGTLDLIKKYPVRLFRIKSEEFNFGLTRNYGFSKANSPIIVTLSQDFIPENERWLENLISPLYEDKNIVAVQGTVIEPDDGNIFYWEKIGEYYYTSELKKWSAMCPFDLSFVNCGLRKNFWEKHQMGDIPFAEDKVFCKAIHESGKRVQIAQDASGFHGHQYNFKTLKKRLIGEGTGWKAVGINYGILDCCKDLYHYKYLYKKAMNEYISGNIKSIVELIYPILRPILIFWGNRI